ncbi:MAG: hypothetical protein L0Z53_08095 [Acidobacteriales bacterium]|nr:hypothetical protein [Terriglobales bacterium]
MGTAPAPSRLPVLEENIAGLLCWLPLGPVPILASAYFLMTAPYKQSNFVRFHATQSIFTLIAVIGLAVAFKIVSSIFTLIFPPIDLLLMPIWGLFSLAVLVVYIYMAYKAYSMESPKLPYIGELMGKYAGE